MVIRLGSLGGPLEFLAPETRRVLLEDYACSRRRDHCSRRDFADGWLALLSRLKSDPEIIRILLELDAA